MADWRGNEVLGTGSLLVRLPIMDGYPTVDFPLERVRVVGSLVDRSLDGTITGHISEQELFATIFPSMEDFVSDLIAADPGCPSACEGANLRILLSLFDDDRDGHITIDELMASSTLRALLRPDLDTDGDSEPDALSVAIGFRALQIQEFGRDIRTREAACAHGCSSAAPAHGLRLPGR